MTELTCHVCGKKYTVEHLDPDSPAAYECIDCYRAELESESTETEHCNGCRHQELCESRPHSPCFIELGDDEVSAPRDKVVKALDELEKAYTDLGDDLDDQFGDGWNPEAYAEILDAIHNLKHLLGLEEQ